MRSCEVLDKVPNSSHQEITTNVDHIPGNTIDVTISSLQRRYSGTYTLTANYSWHNLSIAFSGCKERNWIDDWSAEYEKQDHYYYQCTYIYIYVKHVNKHIHILLIYAYSFNSLNLFQRTSRQFTWAYSSKNPQLNSKQVEEVSSQLWMMYFHVQYLNAKKKRRSGTRDPIDRSLPRGLMGQNIPSPGRISFWGNPEILGHKMDP